MKRLISWLLALTLICGLLPMSVFAAETDIEIGGDNADIETDFSALSPIDLTNDLVIEGDFSATVTVPAKTERFYQASRVAGMFMTINDGEAVACTGDNWTPYTWSIVNATDAEATYTIKVAFPVGHQMNPEVIEELAWSYFTVEQAAGDNDGYFYSYTAPADGTVTLYFTETPCPVYEAPTTDEGGNEVPAKWHADIAVTNNNTYANKSLQYDGVDNYGWELTVDVNAGDELIINTSYFADAEGNMYPAGTYTWCGNFQYPAGSQQNPTEIYVELDNAGAAEVTVTVPAGEHAYYVIYGANGTTLAVNGEGATEITMFNNAVDFDNTEGTEDATYVLSFSTPVGAYMNPEVIEDMNDYEDTGATVEGSPYYYIWTAPADGTVTLDVTDGANITVNNQNTYAQYVLAEVSYDDNMNFGGWTVADNLVIEVAEGDVLKIEVAGYSNDNAWDVPAVDYTLTGDFEGANVEVDMSQYMITFSTMDLSTEAEIQFRYWLTIPEEVLNHDGSYILLTKDGFAGEVEYKYTMAELRESGTKIGDDYILCAGIASPEMLRGITLEAFYGDQNYHFCNKRGVDKGTSFTYSAADYAAIALPSAGDDQKNLIANILTYGGYAQKFFNVDAETPVYDMLADYGIAIPDVTTVTADLFEPYKATASGTGATFSNFENVLDSAVYQRVDFTLDSGVAAEDCVFTLAGVDLLDVAFTTTLEASLVSGTTYRVLVENIPACYWDQMYSVTVANSATGNTYVANTSILGYCRQVVRKPANYSAELVALCQAIYLYNQAANVFYGK